MNKKDFEANLKKAIGQTEYGDEVVADLVEHYESTGKYAQNSKDRIDDRIGSLKGWEKRHKENSDEKAAQVEADKIALLEKALKVVEDMEK